MIEFFIWGASVVVPLLIFILMTRWKFVATLLSCGILCFSSVLDIFLVYNENLWGLLQSELDVSKELFIVYKSILTTIYLILLFITYKKPKSNMIIFAFFILCIALLPFNIMERFLFGK